MLPLSQSMRANYAQGVEEYYSKHASTSYRNPHFPGIVKTLHTFLDAHAAAIAGSGASTSAIHVLDLAAGSGEATEAVLKWSKKHEKLAAPSSNHGRGPQSIAGLIRMPVRASVPLVIDEKAAPLPSAAHCAPPSNASARSSTSPSTLLPATTFSIVATDPFTGPAYRERTGLPCLPLSFADIADDIDALPSPPGVYDLVLCSFALHLLTDTSHLWRFLSALAQRARYLVVLAPHKKPSIKEEWGWKRVDPWNALQDVDEDSPQSSTRDMGGKRGDGYEIYDERVRLRVWRSTMLGEEDTGDDAGAAV